MSNSHISDIQDGLFLAKHGMANIRSYDNPEDKRKAKRLAQEMIDAANSFKKRINEVPVTS